MRHAQPWKSNRSRALRSRATSAEDALWSHIRNRHLGGFKFIRQAPIEAYFVDFLCREHKVIVEVDGGTHGEAHEVAADRVRCAELERLGYRVFRVFNGDVYGNIDGVLDGLLAFLEGRDG